MTDANGCVGKIQPRHCPAVFGNGGDARSALNGCGGAGGKQGADPTKIVVHRQLHLRYAGTEAVRVDLGSPD